MVYERIKGHYTAQIISKKFLKEYEIIFKETNW
jgi:hypothetical protein